STCKAGEGVAFSAVAKNGYNLGCTTHNYTWNFGDPSSAANTSNDATPTHFYNTPGTYTVSLLVSNQTQTSTPPTVQVKVGGSIGTTCPTLTAVNVSPSFSSA